jgi:hypothetical protein
VANLVYHPRWRREQFDQLVWPGALLGVTIDVYVICHASFRTLLSLPFKQGDNIV